MKCYYGGSKKKWIIYITLSLLVLLGIIIKSFRELSIQDYTGFFLSLGLLVCILAYDYFMWKYPLIKLDENKLILNQSGKPKKYLISEISIVKESDKSMVFLDKNTGKQFTIWLYHLTKADVDEFKHEILTLINK